MIRTFASFSLHGIDLDKGKVTAAMGIQPDQCHNKGEEYNKRKTKAKQGYWMITSKDQLSKDATLEEHIVWLLNKIEPKVALDIEGVAEARIFCYWDSDWGHGGPAFSPELLARLGKLRLALELDIYSREEK